ncbi:MAG: hypothetical protein PHI18_01935 [bacterium]|nr:hypothetical protein [bacterium]
MAKKPLTKSGSFPVIGQMRIRRLLAQSLRAGRAAHAYLLVGPGGVGKTAVALEFARLLLCSGDGDQPCEQCDDCRISRTLQHPDLRIVFPLPAVKKSSSSDDDDNAADALSEEIAATITRLTRDPYAATEIEKKSAVGSTALQLIKIGEIRSILHSAMLKPYQAARKVFVICHADTMNDSAQNAFLKVLEEPPEAGYFLLTTEREQMLRPTVRSRCQRIPLFPLPAEDLAKALAESGVEDAAANLSAQLSGGSVTRARELAKGDVRALQACVIDFLKASATCDPFKLPAAADALLGGESFPQHVAFDLLKLFFRDLSVRRSASAQASGLTFGESEAIVDGVLSAFPDVDSDAAARAVDECAGHLARGYTETFALYTLAIRLRECLGPRASTKHSSTRSTHASHA